VNGRGGHSSHQRKKTPDQGRIRSRHQKLIKKTNLKKQKNNKKQKKEML